MKKKSIIAIVAIAIVGVVVAIIGLLLSEDGSFLEGLFSGGGDVDLDLDIDGIGDGDGGDSVINVADNAVEMTSTAGEINTRSRSSNLGSHLLAADIASATMVSSRGEESKKRNGIREQFRKFMWRDRA